MIENGPDSLPASQIKSPLQTIPSAPDQIRVPAYRTEMGREYRQSGTTGGSGHYLSQPSQQERMGATKPVRRTGAASMTVTPIQHTEKTRFGIVDSVGLLPTAGMLNSENKEHIEHVRRMGITGSWGPRPKGELTVSSSTGGSPPSDTGAPNSRISRIMD